MNDFQLGRALVMRFVRGALAGAFASMTTIAYFTGSTLRDLQQWLFLLLISAVIGSVSGGILAVDKYIRSE
jgi:hypothetical protein